MYLNGMRLKGVGHWVDYTLDKDGDPRFEFALKGGPNPDVVQIDTFFFGLRLFTEILVSANKVNPGAKPVWSERIIIGPFGVKGA